MNLSKLYRKVSRKPLKTYWWRYEYPKKLNFGDEITPYIIKNIFGYDCEWTEPNECQLAGAGSIIEVLQQLSSDNQINIWGSGFIKEGMKNKNKNLIFDAVRGELSRERIDSNNSVIGDPGLLLPLAYNSKIRKQHFIGILPHYIDSEHVFISSFSNDPNFKIINILDPIETVINNILKCELIFSSSLHGLIVSDAYNIPNYWLPLSDNITGGDYKYNDYFSSVNKVSQKINFESLNDIDFCRSLIEKYKQPNNIDILQKNLIKKFPF